MQNRLGIELSAGIFLLLGIAALIFLATQATNMGGVLSDRGGYQVTAYFNNIGGLKTGAPVSMAGVIIGDVADINLDRDSFEAVVTLSIASDFDGIPNDSSAAILTRGILGNQYVGLEPGGSPDPLLDGDQLLITQSAVVLEQLIGKFLFEGPPDVGDD